MSRSRDILLAAVAAALVAAPAATGAGTAVTIADTGGPSSRLAADLAGRLLAERGFVVTRTTAASAAAAEAAARAGTLDAYATETATLWERVLARPRERDAGRLSAGLGTTLATRGQSPVAIAGADDAPLVACRRAAAAGHRLSGLASLRAAARRLTYAASAAHVVRADGLASLHVRFRRVIVSPGLGRFDVIGRGRAHCVLASGTEPRVPRLGLVALRDRFRTLAGTPQRPVVVVSDAYRATAPPEFATGVADALGVMSASEAAALRAAVELDGIPGAEAAEAALRRRGLIP